MSYPASIYPVLVCEVVAFVAFDHSAATAFANREDDWHRCAVSEIDELVLVDNFGFPCQIKDAGFLFPWLADVTPETALWMLTAQNVMSEAEREASIRDADYAAYLAEIAPFLEAEADQARMNREL